jgi:hypothetical protein
MLGWYDKRHLVPFGEYVPLSQLLFFVNPLAGGAIGTFAPGDEATVFSIPSGRFSVVICYEAIFPNEVRQFFLGGADFLVNITNDALTAVIDDRLKHRVPVHTKALLLGAVSPDVPLLLLTLGYMAYRRWLDPLQLHEPIYGPRYDALYFHSPVWITAHNILHAPLLITLMIAVGYLG